MDANLHSVSRNLVLGLLLALAAAAWAVIVWQRAIMDAGMATTSATMGMRAPLFLAIWVVMMVAMMLPAAAPMILTFHRIQNARRQRSEAVVSTWIFVAAYMLIWTLAGAAAFALALAAEAVAARTELPLAATARIGGTILIVAGLYQLTPAKDFCLSKCRTPVGFIMTSWRDGAAGAMRMGLLHGAYCLGCCWLLFAILFPLGIMNIAAMALVTLIICAEKALPWGRLATRTSAAGLVAYGALVVAIPTLLPTFTGGSGMTMG